MDKTSLDNLHTQLAKNTVEFCKLIFNKITSKNFTINETNKTEIITSIEQMQKTIKDKNITKIVELLKSTFSNISNKLSKDDITKRLDEIEQTIFTKDNQIHVNSIKTLHRLTKTIANKINPAKKNINKNNEYSFYPRDINKYKEFFLNGRVNVSYHDYYKDDKNIALGGKIH